MPTIAPVRSSFRKPFGSSELFRYPNCKWRPTEELNRLKHLHPLYQWCIFVISIARKLLDCRNIELGVRLTARRRECNAVVGIVLSSCSADRDSEFWVLLLLSDGENGKCKCDLRSLHARSARACCRNFQGLIPNEGRKGPTNHRQPPTLPSSHLAFLSLLE